MTKTAFNRSVVSILVVFLGAIGYVHQQIEIVKTGIIMNKQEESLSFHLDRYRTLVYNLSCLESPKRIEDKLDAHNITLCMPDLGSVRQSALTHLAKADEEGLRREDGETSFMEKFLDSFSTKAEAKVISAH